jgi:hypothetical protein
MVRQIVGALVEIGRGNLSMNDIKKFLYSKSDEPAKLTAPPSGLFLERVYYKGDVWLKEIKPVLEINSKLPMRFNPKHKEQDEKTKRTAEKEKRNRNKEK